MTIAWASLALAATLTEPLSVDESARVRRTFVNGSIGLYERVKGSKTVAIHLFAAAKGAEESTETHGHRHLLEHMLSRVEIGRHAVRMEAASWTVAAETYRDVTVFRFEGPASGLDVAWDAIGSIVRPRTFSSSDMAVEVRLIEQELAILPPESTLTHEAWKLAYEARGLDPLGSLEALNQAGAAAMAALHRRHFASQNLTISIVGDLEADSILERASKVVSNAPVAAKFEWNRRPEGRPGSIHRQNAWAIFAPTPPYSNPKTAWMLAAALAMASQTDDRFVAYTPSIQNGLIVVGSSKNALPTDEAARFRGAANAFFQTGREQALAWATRHRHSVGGTAFWNGLFQSQAFGGRPEVLIENLKAMRMQDFVLGTEALFGGDKP